MSIIQKRFIVKTDTNQFFGKKGSLGNDFIDNIAKAYHYKMYPRITPRLEQLVSELNDDYPNRPIELQTFDIETTYTHVK